MIPLIVLAIGLLLIFFEFYLPGGIFAVLGGLMILTSIFLFASQFDSLILLILYICGVVALLALLIKFTLWKIKHDKPGNSVYLQGDQEGYVASSFETSAIGKIGTVDSDLKPGGHIIVDGKRYLAISLSGYIVRGDMVKVVGGEGESLKVKRYNKETET